MKRKPVLKQKSDLQIVKIDGCCSADRGGGGTSENLRGSDVCGALLETLTLRDQNVPFPQFSCHISDLTPIDLVCVNIEDGIPYYWPECTSHTLFQTKTARKLYILAPHITCKAVPPPPSLPPPFHSRSS